MGLADVEVRGKPYGEQRDYCISLFLSMFLSIFGFIISCIIGKSQRARAGSLDGVGYSLIIIGLLGELGVFVQSTNPFTCGAGCYIFAGIIAVGILIVVFAACWWTGIANEAFGELGKQNKQELKETV